MANKYWVGNGGNWSDTANWSTTSGGAGGTAIPSATADKAIFDANSGDCVINGNYETFDMDITNYPAGKQINVGDNTLTCRRHFNGNNTGVPFITGNTGIFKLGYSTTTATHTFNNVIFDCNFHNVGTRTKTQTGTITINKVYSSINYGQWNGSTIYMKGGYESIGSGYLYGNCNVYFQGGTIGGKITITGTTYLDGDVTFSTTQNLNLSGNSRLEYLSGNITTTGSTLEIGSTGILGSSTSGLNMKVGTNVRFNNIMGALSRVPTLILEDDLYIDGDLITGLSGAGGAASVWQLNGVGMKCYLKGSFHPYTNISSNEPLTGIVGDATLVMCGNGIFMNNSTPLGYNASPANQCGINVEINTAGTFGIDNSKPIYWNSDRFFVHTAGGVTQNGDADYYIEDKYTFDLRETTLINKLTILPNATFTSLTDISFNKFVQENNSTYNQTNQSRMTIHNALHCRGTDDNPCNMVANPIKIFDFKDNVEGTMDAYGLDDTNYKRINFPQTDETTNFTVAFDFKFDSNNPSQRSHFWSGKGYLWIPNNGNHYAFAMIQAGSNGWWLNHNLNNSSPKCRLVVTKQQGQSPKLYIDGVQKVVYQTGSPDYNAGYAVNSFSESCQGDIIWFNEVKDTNWIAQDYQKFVDNNNSSAMTYDNTESGLTLGFHTSEWTPEYTDFKLKYLGDHANQIIHNTIFKFVNAEESSVPIYSWHGENHDCVNIIIVTGEDIGGSSTTQAFVKINGVKKQINLAVIKK